MYSVRTYRYISFSFQDAHTLSFNEFHNTMANITLIRLVDPESQHVKNAIEEIIFNEQKIGKSNDLSPYTIKVNASFLNVYI